MPAIPPAIDTDVEDVVWGLQTADALWKRGERIDAVVWLRRAAQAAMDAEAPSRAVELGRIAAELSDWLATSASAPAPPVADTAPPSDAHAPEPAAEADAPPAETMREPEPRPTPPSQRPPSQSTMQTAQPVFEPPPEEAPVASTPSVPPAEQVHAGMFNPWDEKAPPPPPPPVPAAARSSGRVPAAAASRPPSAVSIPAAPLAPRALSVSPPRAVSAAPPPRAPSMPVVAVSGSTEDSDDEVLTSAPTGSASSLPAVPAAPAAPRVDVPAASPAAAPRKPPPLPPRAKKPAAIPAPRPSDADVETSAPRIPAAAPVDVPVELEDELLESDAPLPSAEAASAAPEPGALAAPPVATIAEPPPEPERATDPEPMRPPEPAAEARPLLELEGVDAFSDLPDDAREAFAAAAKMDRLAEGEEVSHFALAYVLEGEVDVAATVVDAPAMRLHAGAVLRSRGTTNEAVPMRLVATGVGANVATWSDDAVEKAFKTCPWVEDDLRAAADRMLTLVGITIGPLGERLDASIREAIVARLQIRTLEPGEIVVNAGETVPGLLLVGIGELELAKAEGVAVIVGSGEFLFPTEVLGAGSAPYTARAGAGGALVMFGDRHVAQELLVTCPPLLEVFAGM